MPSPLAHIGLALALRAGLVTDAPVLGRAPDAGRWASLRALRAPLLVALASIAPDLDVLPMLVDSAGISWHRGPTHSLVGAAALGGGVAVLGGLRGREALAVVLAAILHVPLDWSTGAPGAPARYGVPWAWPLDAEKHIAPEPWFGAFGIDGAEGLGAMWSAAALAVYGREAATVAVAALVAWAVRTYRV